MLSSRWPAPPIPGDFGFPIGAAAAVVATIAVVTDGGTHHPGWSTIVFAVVIVVMAVVTTPAAVVGTSVVCWFLQAGFVLGRQGDVRITAVSDRAAVVLVGAAPIACAVATVVRLVRRVAGAYSRAG